MAAVCDKEYLARVRRHLTCSAASRQRLLDRAGQMVEDFFRENPEADAIALTTAFGSPQEFAAQMLATLEPGEVEAARKRQRLLYQGGALALILALIAVAAVCFVRWRTLRAIIPEDVYVVIEPAQTLSPEDANQLHHDPNIIWEGD